MQQKYLTAEAFAAEGTTHLVDVLDIVLNYITTPKDMGCLNVVAKGLQATCSAYLVNNSKAGRTLILTAVQKCAHELQHPKRIQPRKLAAMQQSQVCRATISWIQEACGNCSLLCDDYVLRGARSILTSVAQITPEFELEAMEHLSTLAKQRQQSLP